MHLNVDFSSLDEAVARMGAMNVDPGPIVVPGMEPLARIDIDLRKVVEVGLKDIDSNSGDLLSYKGRQVLLYIQDHGSGVRDALADGSKGKRFHVAFCKTLEEMRTKKRFQRYRITTDLSGDFLISGFEYGNGLPVEGYTKLKVCQNCLKHLNYRGFNTGRREAFRDFSLEEFFSTYSSFFPHMPERRAGIADSRYTDDWRTIASKYKATKGFRCENCGVDLSAHHWLLHAHHINGVKTDNNSGNLQALCSDCHRKQPYHEHMFVPHADTQLINQLRREQALMKGSNWDETFELADPAVHGVIHLIKKRNWPIPIVGDEVQADDGRVVAQLELAWPWESKGVAIATADLDAARAQGWTVWTASEILNQF